MKALLNFIIIKETTKSINKIQKSKTNNEEKTPNKALFQRH